MTKFVIRVEKQIALIDDAMDDMELSGRFKKMQMKVYSAVYKSKLNGMFYLMKKKVAGYIDKEGQDYFEAVENGDIEHCILQKKRLEKFMFGTEKELNEEKEYKKFKNDRIVMKVLTHFRGAIVRTKDAAIKKAIGEGQVFDFFTRIGISVTWKIEE